MAGIYLSPKHGVNPSVMVCFFCGEGDRIALFGRLKGTGDAQAPHKACYDYEPCRACEEKMGLGITLIECTGEAPPDGRVAITEEHGTLYPTGRWAVVRPGVVHQIFHPEEVVEAVLKHRKAFIDSDALKRILGDEYEHEKGEGDVEAG